ncbi:MAG: hypothetical protein FJX77_18010, partial [Armatimonadetes bacterium]|nr:hypothetical protein [Armatimonadota bacterium]
ADCLHLVSRTPGGADQVRLRLLGANSSAQVRGEHPLRGHANCLLGNDPARWRRRVPLYRQVRAESVYPGIDLVCYRGGAGLEYDFQVAPGADPGQIRLACEGAARVETAGQELVFHTRYGAFRQQRPRVFQQRDGIEREIAASYRGRARPGAPAGFRLAAYDPALPLVIDPVLTYSTFLGGNRVDERIQGAAVDTAGMVYVTGQTPSTDFPTRNPAQPALGGGLATDAFVAKFDGSRTGADSLVYCTFLGGGNADSGHGVGVDSAGHAYVAGTTHSNDFPVMLPAQGVHGGRVDAFAARLAPDGSRLLYSTYLGGSDDDSAFNLAVTPAGTATVVGSTNSELLQNAAGMVVETSYPLVNPFQADLNRDGAPGMVGGFPDAFVTQLSPAGGINYSTYLGGARDDRALAAALDSAGNATITGDTTSANFPTTVGVVQPMFGSSSVLSPDGFLSRLSPTGEYRIGTYLGGPSVEIGRGVGVDAAGFAYVVLELLAGTGAEVRRLNTDL